MAAYFPPVDQLIPLGEISWDNDWLDYSSFNLTADDIPELIRMLTDDDLHELMWDDPVVWAPVHALRALASLRAAEAVEPLLQVMERRHDDDWLYEELEEACALIGEAAIAPLAQCVCDIARYRYARASAGDALCRIAQDQPQFHPACVAALANGLEQFADNDPALNGFLIADLMKLDAVETAPLVERAFEAGRVDQSICGDWEDVQLDLGLLSERLTPRPRYHDLIDSTPRFEFPPLAYDQTPEQRRELAQSRNKQRKAEQRAKTERKKAKNDRKGTRNSR